MYRARRELEWDAIAANCSITEAVMAGGRFDLTKWHPYRKAERTEHDITILKKLLPDGS